MGRVNADRVLGLSLEAHIRTGLGAVSVQHVEIEGFGDLQELHRRRHVGG